MFRIIYISGETTPFTTDKLENLLKQSREKNTEADITGLLLYKHGNFLQIIEGQEKPVRFLFEKITSDPRHRRVIPVLQEPINNRDFENWSMAFRDLNLSTSTVPAGFSHLLNTPWDQLDVQTHSDTIQRFLKVFIAATA